MNDLLKPRTKPSEVASFAGLRPLVLRNARNGSKFLNERSRKLGRTLPVTAELPDIYAVRVRLWKRCRCISGSVKQFAQALISGHSMLKAC
jgi:hypothetical protein